MTKTLLGARRAVIGVLLALLALGLWADDRAWAADNITIDHAQPTEGAVRLLVSVPGTDTVDYGAVQATLDGRRVTTAAEPASRSSVVARTSVLAIDTSQSMAGRRIAEAKKAALAYLAAVPDNVKVGVVSFDRTVKVVVPPGLDRNQARAAIARLTLTLQTALYPGVLKALEAAGPGGDQSGQKKVLLLSDGKDTTGTALSDVLTAITKSGVRVDVVSLQAGDETNQQLTAIAAAGKGRLLATKDPAELSAAFAREADALARQVLVTAMVPAGSRTNANVEVIVPTDGQGFTAAAYVPVRSAADLAAQTAAVSGPQPVKPGLLAFSPKVMYGAVGAIALGLLGMVALLGKSSRPASKLTLNEQIKAYRAASGSGPPGSRADQPAENTFAGGARRATEKALSRHLTFEARVARRLDGAGMSLRPAEWLLMQAAIAVGAGLVGILLGSGSIFLGVLFVIVGLVGPRFYLRRKRSRRLTAFGQGLSDTLQLMSGSLSAGLSLAQSIDTIVREGSEPIAGEFRRVVIETRLGVSLEDSLEGVAERMDSRDFEWVVMAIRIQRAVGGNLAELLLTVAATLREREFLRRHVRALSAEGRLSCFVLGGLPPVFLLYLTLSKPDYVHPLYTTPIGWILCTGVIILLSVGMFWMTKVSKVDL